VNVRRRILALSGTALCGLVLTGCGSSGDSTGSGAAGVDIRATDTACELSGGTTLQPGRTSFNITNSGSKVTEVYLYGKAGEAFTTVVSEVEDLAPGITREMTADLAAGTYQLACKPGQTGDGIRTTITVGTAAQAATATGTGTGTGTAVAREIPLSTDGTKIGGLESASGTVGETIEFELTNGASGARNLEVKRPDGSVAGEVEIAAGAQGKLKLELTVAGAWKVILEGAEPVIEQPFEVR
jgi:iron uptake system component EfeO